MKKIVITALALCAVAIAPRATAQIGLFPQGGAQVEGYTLPRTVVTVTLVVEREVILRGPYARYASQYLGVSGAAMNDRESYKIVDAAIGYYQEPDPVHTYQLASPVGAASPFQWLNQPAPTAQLLSDTDYKNAQPGGKNPFTDVGINPIYGTTTQQILTEDEEGFGQVPINRTTTVEKSPEQMAQDAANTIFTLRKRRFDLVTGEAGEVFGAGFPAAIKEMERIENEYLALFIGKRFTQKIVRTFSVLPQNAATMVCRFSETAGIVPDSDLSGRPVMLQLSAEPGAGEAAAPVATGSRGKTTATVTYRLPSSQVARVLEGSQELARERVPVFQFGQMTQVSY